MSSQTNDLNQRFKLPFWLMRLWLAIIVLNSLGIRESYGQQAGAIGAGEGPGAVLLKWLYRPKETTKSLHSLQHPALVSKVLFTPDGKQLITASRDGVRVWDTKDYKLLRHFRDLTGWVQCAVSHDGNYLAMSGLPSRLVVWDLRRDCLYAELGGLDDCVVTMEFVPRSLHLVALSVDGILHSWNLSTQGEHSVLAQEGWSNPHNISLSFFGSDKIIFGFDCALYRLRALDGRLSIDENTAPRFGPHFVLATVAVPNSPFVVTSGETDRLLLWKPFASRGALEMENWAHMGSRIHRSFGVGGFFPLHGFFPLYDGELYGLREYDCYFDEVHIEQHWYNPRFLKYYALAAFPYGRYVAAGASDGVIRIFDLLYGLEVMELKGHDGIVLTLAVSPDGTLLASGAKDKSVQIWEVGMLHSRP